MLFSGFSATVTTPIDEGGTVHLTGTVSDPGIADPIRLEVDWGDGMPVQTVNLPAGSTSFDVPHVYADDDADDQYTIGVTLRNDSPTPAATFYGGAGDQAGVSVASGNGQLYVAGSRGSSGAEQGLLLDYATPPGTSPTWNSVLSSRTYYRGVSAWAGGIFAVGGAMPPAYGSSDGSGGTEQKTLYARHALTGELSWASSNNFFSYRGGEQFEAAVAVEEAGTTYLYATGYAQAGGANNTAVLAKYTESGTLVWRRDLGDTGSSKNSSGNGLAVLNGAIYVSGYTHYPYTDPNAMRTRLWKYDAAGVQQWVRDPGMASGSGPVAAADGAIYLAGTAGAGGTVRDVLVQKYTEAGVVQWTRSWGGAAEDVPGGIGVAGDRVYVSGSTESYGAGGKDVFVLELDAAAGTVLSNVYFGGAQADVGNGAVIHDRALYVVGESKSFAVGGNAVGQNDVLLLRYSLPLSPACTTIPVTVHNVPPTIQEVANSGPVDEGSAVTITVTATDPAGVADLLTYEFDFDNDGNYDQSGTAGSVHHTFDDDGQYTVGVRVSDDDGGQTTASSVVVVRNVAPQLAGLAITTPIDEGSVATLSGSIVDPGMEDAYLLVVDWGDGTVPERFSYLPGTTAFEEQHRYLDDDPCGTSADDYVVHVAIQDGASPSDYPTPVPLAAPQTAGELAVGDFNGDGRPDLALAQNVGTFPNNPGVFSVLLNDGAGGFFSGVQYNPGGGAWTGAGIATADFNNDGNLDIVLTHGGTNSLAYGNRFSLSLGRGDGTFVPGGVVTTGGSVSRATAGDFDEDGKMDVALITHDSNAVTIHRGNGGGGFSGSTAIPLGARNGTDLVARDLNQDGHLDLAVPVTELGRVKLFFGAGDGTFTASPAVLPVTNPRGLQAGDFDRDGNPDLAIASTSPGEVVVFLGTGGGSYGSGGAFPAIASAWMLDVGDYNVDGLLDIVVGSDTGSDVAILGGDGEGHFALPLLVPAGGSQLGRIRVADFNADGLPDLVATSGQPSGASVLMNPSSADVAEQTVTVANVPPEVWIPGVQLDPSFGQGGLIHTAVPVSLNSQGLQKVAVQPDGKILLAGNVHTATGTDALLIRYNADGSLDSGFGSGGIVLTDFGASESAPTEDYFWAMTLLPDGKIAVAGTIYGLESGIGIGVARYGTDGSLDGSFGAGGRVATAVGEGIEVGAWSMAAQSDGAIVVAGQVSSPALETGQDFALIRYDAEGAIDTGFGEGGFVLTDFGGQADAASSVVVLPDGKIVAIGTTEAGGTADFAAARYLSNGSLDTPFGVGGQVTTDLGGADHACDAVLLEDGRLVVGGWSTAADGKEDMALARYLPNGSPDPTFRGGSVLTDWGDEDLRGYGLALQRDGRLVVAGTVNGYGGDFALVRYEASGALDEGFGQDGLVRTDFALGMDLAFDLAVQPDGRIVVGGMCMASGTGWYGLQAAVARYLPGYVEGGQVVLPAAGYDPGRDSLDVAWTVTKDGAAYAAGSSLPIVFQASGDGSYTATLSVEDDDGGVGQRGVTFNVVNLPPTAVNDGYSMTEDSRLSVATPGILSNDADPGGDPLAAEWVAGPSHGSLTIAADGSFTYTPEADYNGLDTFSYQTGDGTTSSNIATVTLAIRPVTDVTGRHLFYNNSAFDGNDPNANVQDYSAVAPLPPITGHGHAAGQDESDKPLGKQALLPGQTATFANYASYAKGVNGILIAFDDLALPGSFTEGDVEFHVGNDDVPSNWALAPAPRAFRVEQDVDHPDFPGRPDVLTITWVDENPFTPSREAGAISNQWLQVTVLANARTGLPVNDVFYFGNQIGESGNSVADTNVDQNDEIGARNHPHTAFNPAALSDPYDFNRDGKVDQNDEILARNNPATAFTRIQRIVAPAMLQAAGADGALRASVVDEAMARSQNAALDDLPIPTLRKTPIALADLHGSVLAEAPRRAKSVVRDDETAGFGRYLDPPPDAVTAAPPRPAETTSLPAERIDLWMAVMREWGRVVGHPDTDSLDDDLMASRMAPEIRREIAT